MNVDMDSQPPHKADVEMSYIRLTSQRMFIKSADVSKNNIWFLDFLRRKMHPLRSTDSQDNLN